MSELSEAISEMRNMRESYDQLAATADLYQQGRTALAAAITAKGVPTTPTTPLADMAENVGDIQQVTTTIDGDDMYAAQLFGDGVLWNLYDVLAQMKSQYMGAGHYAALIVCEYYKGYDSLQLQGADAYYTCDGDFYDYDALHTWHDSENGKSNRWVCFLYQQEGARLDITNTAISPRSMYIGGHIGTIEYFVNGRLTDLVSGVEETDVVDKFLTKTYTQAWGFNCILRGIKSIGNADNLTITSAGTIYIESEGDLMGGLQYNAPLKFANASYISFPKVTKIYTTGYGFMTATSAIEISFESVERFDNLFNGGLSLFGENSLLRLNLKKLTTCALTYYPYITGFVKSPNSNLIDIVVGEMISNIPLGGWNPTNVLEDATKKAQLIDNIKNHILARVSDRTELSQLVFTVSTNMYNAIATENIEWQGETMTLADAFLTKNWRLAGA